LHNGIKIKKTKMNEITKILQENEITKILQAINISMGNIGYFWCKECEDWIKDSICFHDEVWHNH